MSSSGSVYLSEPRSELNLNSTNKFLEFGFSKKLWALKELISKPTPQVKPLVRGNSAKKLNLSDID